MPRKQPEGYRIRPWRGKLALVWYEGGRRRRHSLGTADPAEAERLRADIIARLEQELRPERPTIGQIMEAYQKAKLPEVASPWAIVNAWKALQPHFGSLYPEHVTEDSCLAYQRARTDAGKKLGTPRQELGVLRSGLKWAEKKTLIARAPHVWLPEAPPPKERHLTRKEAGRLVAAAEMPHVRLYILLGLYTAGRMRAILDLTWDRVDLDRRLITLGLKGLPKRSKGRATVPIPNALFPALVEAKKGALTEYVVEWGGEPVGSIKKGFRAACERAGLEDVTPHTLRHSAATWMAEAGVDMERIAQYLGHADPAITRRVYAKFAPDFLRGAAQALDGPKKNVLPGSVRGSTRTEKRTAYPKRRQERPKKPSKAPGSPGR